MPARLKATPELRGGDAERLMRNLDRRTPAAPRRSRPVAQPHTCRDRTRHGHQTLEESSLQLEPVSMGCPDSRVFCCCRPEMCWYYHTEAQDETLRFLATTTRAHWTGSPRNVAYWSLAADSALWDWHATPAVALLRLALDIQFQGGRIALPGHPSLARHVWDCAVNQAVTALYHSGVAARVLLVQAYRDLAAMYQKFGCEVHKPPGEKDPLVWMRFDLKNRYMRHREKVSEWYTSTEELQGFGEPATLAGHELRFEVVGCHHDLGAFLADDPETYRYLQEEAQKDLLDCEALTAVLLHGRDPTPLGYCTQSTDCLWIETRHDEPYPIPAVSLHRFGIHSRFERAQVMTASGEKSLAAYLLDSIRGRLIRLNQTALAARLLLVHVRHDALRLWHDFGFEPLERIRGEKEGLVSLYLDVCPSQRS